MRVSAGAEADAEAGVDACAGATAGGAPGRAKQGGRGTRGCFVSERAQHEYVLVDEADADAARELDEAVLAPGWHAERCRARWTRDRETKVRRDTPRGERRCTRRTCIC